jgi:hypothetical protein
VCPSYVVLPAYLGDLSMPTTNCGLSGSTTADRLQNLVGLEVAASVMRGQCRLASEVLGTTSTYKCHGQNDQKSQDEGPHARPSVAGRGREEEAVSAGPAVSVASGSPLQAAGPINDKERHGAPKVPGVS